MNLFTINKNHRAVYPILALGFSCFVVPVHATDSLDAKSSVNEVVPESKAPIALDRKLDGGALDFTALDINADGKLSAKEAVNDSFLMAKFEVADLDKDGTISKKEYDKLKKQVHLKQL